MLTEQIFAIPGFGKMLVDGVFNRDYAVVQGVVLVSAGLYVLLNLMADVLYFLANPRLRGCVSDADASPADRRAPGAATRRGACCAAPARRARRAGGGAFVVIAVAPRAVLAPYDPIKTDTCAVRKAPSGRAPARHRRGRPRRALAPDLGRPRLAAGRRRPGDHRAAA